MKAKDFLKSHSSMNSSERIDVLLRMSAAEIARLELTHELYLGRTESVDFRLKGKLIFGLNIAILMNPSYFKELCEKDCSFDSYMKLLSNTTRV